MASTQLKDKDGTNVYPAVEGGSEGGGFDYTAQLAYAHDLCTISGKFIGSNGGEEANNYWKCTDFLPLFGKSITVRYTKPRWWATTGSFRGYFAFYDENKTFISGKAYKCETGMTDSGITISLEGWDTEPAYVRFSIAVTNPNNATYIVQDRFLFRATQVVSGAKAVDVQIDNMRNGGIYKVLMFGNSFTNNTLDAIESILTDFNINSVLIQGVAIASANLVTFSSRISSANDVCEDSEWMIYSGGGMAVSLASMSEVLSHDWDFVSFQTSSTLAADYSSTADESLTALIAATKQYCTNKDVKIGWLMSWSTRQNGVLYTHQSIANAVKSMKALHPDVVVIPVGTAVENARGTSLNDSGGYLCGDYLPAGDNQQLSYQHLGSGAGKYTAACCFFLKVLEPVIGKNIFDNSYSFTRSQNANAGVVSVDDTNRFICQKAAWYACVNPYAVTPAEWLDPDYVAPTS